MAEDELIFWSERMVVSDGVQKRLWACYNVPMEVPVDLSAELETPTTGLYGRTG